MLEIKELQVLDARIKFSTFLGWNGCASPAHIIDISFYCGKFCYQTLLTHN